MIFKLELFIYLPIPQSSDSGAIGSQMNNYSIGYYFQSSSFVRFRKSLPFYFTNTLW